MDDGPSVGPLKYNLLRDLAIFELRHPLRDYHGATFSIDELQVGQEVDIYALQKEPVKLIRSLLRIHGTFRGETTAGLLTFDYTLSQAGKGIRPGATGGIVVDSKTQEIVGVLSAIAVNRDGVALAVPVQSLAEFVTKTQPYLTRSIFPASQTVSPVSADLYPQFAPPPTIESLQHRPEESAEIKLLRSKAQLLADGMRNFIAVQTFAWGIGNKVPAAVSAYEVRVLDGFQRFRKYPDGNKELHDVPFPALNTAMVPGGEWSELPEMVGTEFRLRIRQAPDVMVNDRRMKVLQYRADSEDAVCRWKSVADFGLFALNKVATVACYGEVWTDEKMNILRMSEHYELPGKWKDDQAVVTYGWLEGKNEVSRLIQLTISTQAEFLRKTYWCRVQFANYQEFRSEVRIAAN